MSDSEMRELSVAEINEVGGGMWWILALAFPLGVLAGYGGVRMYEDITGEYQTPKNSKDKGPGSGWDK